MKQIKTSARVADTEFAINYRFVKNKELVMRSAASARAPQLVVLHFGQTVKILKQAKDFTLVEWRGQDDILVHGWVFSRYLSPFN